MYDVAESLPLKQRILTTLKRDLKIYTKILPQVLPAFLTKSAFFGVSSEKIETVLSIFVMEEFWKEK